MEILVLPVIAHSKIIPMCTWHHLVHVQPVTSISLFKVFAIFVPFIAPLAQTILRVHLASVVTKSIIKKCVSEVYKMQIIGLQIKSLMT